ncbi:uncharacterized protein ARMOST_02164 [Armillaria ostoyae]|uniref:Uncharacterized protein n=1 Tax=Armillaria ostoyae TaxID=47428 RepID=A0A284QQY7_ARMOS|nr:uncharacterized protein ARMOST_02164 [Armillaria ostoyae]
MRYDPRAEFDLQALKRSLSQSHLGSFSIMRGALAALRRQRNVSQERARSAADYHVKVTGESEDFDCHQSVADFRCTICNSAGVFRVGIILYRVSVARSGSIFAVSKRLYSGLRTTDMCAWARWGDKMEDSFPYHE